MPESSEKYWEVQGYHGGEPVVRLNRKLLEKDFGSDRVEQMLVFRAAHFAFMEIKDIPGIEYDTKRTELSKTIEAYIKKFPGVNLYDLLIDAPAAVNIQASQ